MVKRTVRKEPLVSVVVPCLNRAHFLVPTIESILQQDYPNIECIVVDGGSTDGTIEILKRYEDRVKWVSESDKGQADAINKGWRMSKGKVLAWLNADDVWKVPDAVSQAVVYLQAHPEVDVVYGNCGAIDVEGNLIGMSYLHEWDLEYAVKYCDHCIPQPAAFIRRWILERVGWLDTNFIIMDQDLWYRIGLTGTIKHVPTLLAYARSHASFWHSKSHIVAANCVQIIRKFFDNPDLAADVRGMKYRAVSNAYLRGIDYAWIGHHWKVIFYYAFRAVLVDPTNTLNALRHLGYMARLVWQRRYPR